MIFVGILALFMLFLVYLFFAMKMLDRFGKLAMRGNSDKIVKRARWLLVYFVLFPSGRQTVYVVLADMYLGQKDVVAFNKIIKKVRHKRFLFMKYYVTFVCNAVVVGDMELARQNADKFFNVNFHPKQKVAYERMKYIIQIILDYKDGKDIETIKKRIGRIELKQDEKVVKEYFDKIVR